MRSTLFALVLSTLCLAACGVDTTGLTSESTKQPKGNPTASVVVTEYADLQCPACKGAHEVINRPLIDQFGDRVRFDFKHFPLQNIHRFALESAQASECAADQGKFWEYLDVNYANQADLSSEAIRGWAESLKLDMATFERCLASGIKKKIVLQDYADGGKLGVNSTPSYFVNGKKVQMQQMTDLITAVEAALKQTTAAPL